MLNDSPRDSTSRSFDWQEKRGPNGDASTWLPLAKYNKYAYGKVARLVQKLDERKRSPPLAR